MCARAEVVVDLVTDYPEVRLAPGSRLWTGEQELVVRSSRPFQQRWLVQLRGGPRPDRGGTLAGRTLSAEPLEDPEALWVHELIGSRVVEQGSGVERGRVVAVVANPAHELLELDSGALVPDRLRAVVRGRGHPRSPRPRASSTSSPRSGTVRIDVFTIFPALVDGFCPESLLGRARPTGLLDLRCHDLRDHTTDVHRTVDDAPFGGGAGMVLRPEPVFATVEAADPPRPLYLLGPGGRRFDQALARELAGGDGLQPAVRPLRGRRPPGPRAPGRRRAVDRRLRAGRGRGGGLRGDRGGHPAAARA